MHILIFKKKFIILFNQIPQLYPKVPFSNNTAKTTKRRYCYGRSNSHPLQCPCRSHQHQQKVLIWSTLCRYTSLEREIVLWCSLAGFISPTNRPFGRHPPPHHPNGRAIPQPLANPKLPGSLGNFAQPTDGRTAKDEGAYAYTVVNQS